MEVVLVTLPFCWGCDADHRDNFPPPPFSRTQHIISAASGHQVSNRGGAKYSISGKDYNTSRNQKLKQQFTAAIVKPGDDTGAGNENAVGADSGGKAVKETFVVQSRIFGMSLCLVDAGLAGL